MTARYRPLSVSIALLGLTAIAGCGGQTTQGGSEDPDPGAGGTDVEEIDSDGADYEGPELPEGMDELRFGWAQLTDYSSRNPTNDEIEGLYVDVARDIAEDIGVDIVFSESTWPTIVLGLEADKYDFTFVGKTEERETQSDFTEDLLEADFTFAVREGETEELPDFDALDVEGNTIGVTTGSNTDEALTPLVENAEILRVQDVGGVLLAVQNGQADAMAGVRDYLLASIEGYPLETVDSAWGTSVQGITVPPGNDELLEVMSYQAERLKDEGVIEDLIEKYELIGVEASE
ncbi:substrate-binding periplasmic protein [Nesterenkonia lutea]|uniref:Polar amino acid transport system substrate-binding protein n=1 Tax=Nesterenkonia lutea TaxID=272919 RepID=A0ABR9JI83_9MICC|nr:transporter substrate-binding domain-containing protein [Nesterenkonia lutea]MBE1525536.1 polar amino acid transport system substrate-binding protein [Nesterenkonia lutea]